MLPFIPSRPTRRLDPSEYEVVARRVNRPWAVIEVRLEQRAGPGTEVDLGRGVLRLDARDPVVQPAVPVWEASGRLVRAGYGLVRFSRVRLDVTEWSDGACELRLRPVSRRLRAWGIRRERRYFALAHLAADRVLHRLEDDGGDGAQVIPCPITSGGGETATVHRRAS